MSFPFSSARRPCCHPCFWSTLCWSLMGFGGYHHRYEILSVIVATPGLWKVMPRLLVSIIVASFFHVAFEKLPLHLGVHLHALFLVLQEHLHHESPHRHQSAGSIMEADSIPTRSFMATFKGCSSINDKEIIISHDEEDSVDNKDVENDVEDVGNHMEDASVEDVGNSVKDTKTSIENVSFFPAIHLQKPYWYPF
ncbi:hypothetical protein VNO80_19161 [Phaseolus coccineus]|uniref:Uncharacterized protein n=1 Tax=Phaseolus coccineus TaxID=3886 RepID=A0AAN9MFH8_PHACN